MDVTRFPTPAVTPPNWGRQLKRSLLPALTSWPIFCYGNSYGVLASSNFTAGNHYLDQASDEMESGGVASYAVSGSRIIDVWAHAASAATWPGSGKATAPNAEWPGTTARNGLVVLECAVNDTGHYASGATPAAITSANTQYVDSMKNTYRAVLALLSSETRVEQTAATATSGVWTGPTGGPYSGDSIHFTTAAGAYKEFSVTPPQEGPLAGKVFVVLLTQNTGTGTLAQVAISVDGGAATNTTPSPWESYTDSAAVNTGVACIPVTLPVDNAAHTIRIAHNGAGGELLWLDVIPVPSSDPNPIFVMGGETMPVANGAGWNATQVGIYKGNWAKLSPHIKAVVAEFPNAIYVPSTATSEGLWSGDGIHLNDLGMTQHANDLLAAVQTIKPRLDSRALRLAPSSLFPVM